MTPIALGSTGRTRIFHVHHKPLYTAIGEPDNRNRRRVTIDRAIERLMILDGVLADRSVTWLGSEREKRRYFNSASATISGTTSALDAAIRLLETGTETSRAAVEK